MENLRHYSIMNRSRRDLRYIKPVHRLYFLDLGLKEGHCFKHYVYTPNILVDSYFVDYFDWNSSVQSDNYVLLQIKIFVAQSIFVLSLQVLYIQCNLDYPDLLGPLK